MDSSRKIKQIILIASRLSFNLSIALHKGLSFFIGKHPSFPDLEEWVVFEHFIRNVAKQSIFKSVTSNRSKGIQYLVPPSEPMLIKKTDLKIQLDGLESIYFLIPHELLCRFIILCEAKYRHHYSRKVAYELLAYNSKADYVLFNSSKTLKSHLPESVMFLGLKITVTSFKLPNEFLKWLLASGVIPITPELSMIRKIGYDLNDWKFLLSIASFNRLIGQSNLYPPYPWQVRHVDIFQRKILAFMNLLDDRKPVSVGINSEIDNFDSILNDTIITLRNRKRMKQRGLR